ncbi:piggyBac transposable element-derived protein 4-like [Calliphora vicina]|uniref:piggyBac transposable element-derived protein 4-like n=1 Tax=Calliphora vicina TaxID=7373 RepID=UPI00325AB613
MSLDDDLTGYSSSNDTGDVRDDNVFAAVMSGRRFQQILRCFSYHESYEQVKWTGKLEKVIPLLNLVLRSFRNNYRPNKELSLDESLMLFKGRLSFKQYNKGTRAKYGIKFYELTSNDGYILNAEIYAGKVIEDTIGSKTKTVVLKLMDPFLNRGHHLFMDNYYNSVKMSQTLLHYKTHTTGTLRFNRKPNPKCITTKKLKKGEMIWRRTGNVYVTK